MGDAEVKRETIRIMPVGDEAPRVLVGMEREVKQGEQDGLPDECLGLAGGDASQVWSVSIDRGSARRLEPPASNDESLPIGEDGKRILFEVGDLGLEITTSNPPDRGAPKTLFAFLETLTGGLPPDPH